MTHTVSPNEKLTIETMPEYPITVNVGDVVRYRISDRYGPSITRGDVGVCRVSKIEPTMKGEWVVHFDEGQSDGTFKPSLCRYWEHQVEFAYLDAGEFHAFYWRAIPDDVRDELTKAAEPEWARLREARKPWYARRKS